MKQKIISIFKNKFIKNTSWILFAQIYQMSVSLLIGVICARYLGPSNYGLINLGGSYVSFFLIISAFGLDAIVIKDIISHRRIEGKILGTSIVIRLLLSVVSIVCVIILVMFINKYDKILLIVVFLQSLALFFSAFHIIEVWYQSHLNSKIPAIIKCVAYTVISIYKITLLITNKNVIWFAFSTSLDALIIAFLLVYMYKKDSIKKFNFNKKIAFSLLCRSYHIVISYIMIAIYCQMDRIMIGKFIDQHSVGVYSAAAIICHIWLFVPQAISNSARTIIIEKKSEDYNEYVLKIKQLIFVLIVTGTFFSAILIIFNKYIVMMLYGSQYVDATHVIPYLAVSTFFASLSHPRSIWMICENKQVYNKYIVICGVLANLLLNLCLIPRLGIEGAAIATLLTEFICCFISPALIKEMRAFLFFMLESPFSIIKAQDHNNDQ